MQVRTGDQLGREGAAGGTAARACCAPSRSGIGAMNGTGEGGLQVQSRTFHENFACGAGRPAFTSRRPPEYDWPDECALRKRIEAAQKRSAIARFSACGTGVGRLLQSRWPPGVARDQAGLHLARVAKNPVASVLHRAVGKGGIQLRFGTFDARFAKKIACGAGAAGLYKPPAA